MKYRLVELLRCIRCGAGLELSVTETRPAPNTTRQVFPCREYCNLERTSKIPAAQRCATCVECDIVTGTLSCSQCRRVFPIIRSVPWLFEEPEGQPGVVLSDTAKLYSHVWETLPLSETNHQPHVEAVQEALGQSVVEGRIGLDAGSGPGLDTDTMARRHPEVEVISLDISEGIYQATRRAHGLPNVHAVRGSVLSIPLRSEVCDFGYSFGVLHHTTDPEQGLKEIVRTLKSGASVSLYLYEDHAGNPWKAVPLKFVAALRRVTSRLNRRLLRVLCYVLSPLVVLAFSLPAQILGRFLMTRSLAELMPFNFGTTPLSVHADLMDRFGAPIEVRYSREQVMALLQSGNLTGARTAKMKATAGWVARGTKK